MGAVSSEIIEVYYDESMNDWVTYEVKFNFLKHPGYKETPEEVPFAVADGLGAVAGVPLAEEGKHRGAIQ